MSTSWRKSSIPYVVYGEVESGHKLRLFPKPWNRQRECVRRMMQAARINLHVLARAQAEAPRELPEDIKKRLRSGRRRAVK
jgi:hypothetical protein